MEFHPEFQTPAINFNKEHEFAIFRCNTGEFQSEGMQLRQLNFLRDESKFDYAQYGQLLHNKFPFFDCNYIPLSVHLPYSMAWLDRNLLHKSAKLVAISCRPPQQINYSFIVFRCGQSLTIFGLCLSHSHSPNWFAYHLFWPFCPLPNPQLIFQKAFNLT